MIRVHTYCSYKLSPSGFQYGTFDITDIVTDDAAKNMYYLSDENKESVVSSAFDYGIVKRIKGLIPKKNTYIFLFKKIFYTYGSEHDDVGGDVSLNMAFEFDDYMQFIAFSDGFEYYEKNNPLELARQLADCIVPDISVTKFKLTIHKKKIDDWLKLMIDNQKNIGADQSELQKQLKIIVTDSNSCENQYSDDLQEIFKFDTINKNGDEVGIDHLEGAVYVYPSKKKVRISRIPLTPKKESYKNFLRVNKILLLKILKILAIILIIGLVVVLIIIKNNNKSHAAGMNQYVNESDECNVIDSNSVMSVNSDTGSHTNL